MIFYPFHNRKGWLSDLLRMTHTWFMNKICLHLNNICRCVIAFWKFRTQYFRMILCACMEALFGFNWKDCMNYESKGKSIFFVLTYFCVLVLLWRRTNGNKSGPLLHRKRDESFHYRPGSSPGDHKIWGSANHCRIMLVQSPIEQI